MSTIRDVKAREMLDSRGNPTVEAVVTTKEGKFVAMVPSGASTGTHEALELRDNEKDRFLGKGVQTAVYNVNKLIARKLIGKNVKFQEQLDQIMIDLDGTPNKAKLGANAILAVSMAVCMAGAAAKRVPLYQHIATLGGNKKLILPVPMVLVLEGGKHADQSSDIQEFMIMPYKAKNFREAIRIGSEIYQHIGKVLKKQGFNTNVGYEGAFGPSLGSNERVFQVIIEGIKQAGYKPGEEIVIATDPASSEFYKDGKYNLACEKRTVDSKGLIAFYKDLCTKYPIFSIEDGLAEDDWEAWTEMTRQMGNKIQIVGDDLTVTNVERLQKAIDTKAMNAILIKVNQIGSVTETIKAINLAKKHGLRSVVSHRSAETEDTFIADFVVGMGTGQCKFGAPARGERTAKYNRLMRIEEDLGRKASYGGKELKK